MEEETLGACKRVHTQVDKNGTLSMHVHVPVVLFEAASVMHGHLTTSCCHFARSYFGIENLYASRPSHTEHITYIT